MKLNSTVNIYKINYPPSKMINFEGCSGCSISSCSLRNNCIKAKKAKMIEPFKIIKNCFKLLILGIILYAGYDQFFADKNKPNISSKIINTDKLKFQSTTILNDANFIPIEDAISKIHTR